MTAEIAAGMTAERDPREGRIRRRVSLVLMLIDDFNNKVILGSNARLWIPGAKAPIRKAEGYYVFSNLEDRQVRIFIEAGLYESRTLQIKLDSEGYTFLKVRMTPNRSYPVPKDTTCVEGRAAPGSTVRIVCLEDSRPLKLIYDYERGGSDSKKISIYHQETTDIEGKVLYIENGKSGAEFFRVLQRQEKSGDYTLEQPLTANYKKIGTTVYLVYSGTADEKGVFFLPISNLPRETNRFLCEASGERTIRLERQFKTGIVNQLDFTAEGG